MTLDALEFLRRSLLYVSPNESVRIRHFGFMDGGKGNHVLSCKITDMLPNRSMPRSTVLPELAYPSIGDAIERLCQAFGFTIRIRMGDHRAA